MALAAGCARSDLEQRIDKLERNKSTTDDVLQVYAMVTELQTQLILADVLEHAPSGEFDKDTRQAKLVAVKRERLWFCTYVGPKEPVLFLSCFRRAENCLRGAWNELAACVVSPGAWCFDYEVVGESKKAERCVLQRDYCERSRNMGPDIRLLTPCERR